MRKRHLSASDRHSLHPARAPGVTGRFTVAIAVSAVLAGLGATSARADDPAVDALKQQLQKLQQQVDALQQQAQSGPAAPAATGAPAPAATSGSFYAGPIKITPGGFVELMVIDRNRNESADWASNYNTAIPFPSSHNYYLDEFHLTERQSRLQALVEGPANEANKVWGYVEMDFGGSTTNGNNNQSSSFGPRVRHFYADYQNKDSGFSLLFGQTWSFVTAFKTGLTPRQENIPLTIDGQYVPGFDWLRVPQVRFTETFNDAVSAGIAFENPAAQVAAPSTNAPGTAAAPNLINDAYYLQAGASNAYASTTNVTTDSLPDIVGKIAVDPGYGHYEVFGLVRWFRDRYTLTNAQSNETTHGSGVGADLLLPLVPKWLDFQASVLIGNGVGRYGSTGEPDTTIDPSTGALSVLHGFQALGGLTLHAAEPLTFFAYGGVERVDGRSFSALEGANTYLYGYGNPLLTNNSGCEVEGGTCNGATRGIVSGTLGGWYKFYEGPLGFMEVGASDTYIKRQIFAGTGGDPTTNINIFLISFRYYPLQK